SRRVVAGVAPVAKRRAYHRCPKGICREPISLRARAVGQGLQAGRGTVAFGTDTHIHAHAHEDMRHARILTDRPVPRGGHSAVDQQLQQGIARGGAGFAVVGPPQCTNEIRWMVIADELKRIGNARDDILRIDMANRHAIYFRLMPASLMTGAQRFPSCSVKAWNALGEYASSGSSLMPCSAMLPVKAWSCITSR